MYDSSTSDDENEDEFYDFKGNNFYSVQCRRNSQPCFLAAEPFLLHILVIMTKTSAIQEKLNYLN